MHVLSPQIHTYIGKMATAIPKMELYLHIRELREVGKLIVPHSNIQNGPFYIEVIVDGQSRRTEGENMWSRGACKMRVSQG